jgi:hypothetical protein
MNNMNKKLDIKNNEHSLKDYLITDRISSVDDKIFLLKKIQELRVREPEVQDIKENTLHISLNNIKNENEKLHEEKTKWEEEKLAFEHEITKLKKNF